MDYLTDIPVLLRHIINELFSLQGLELWHRIRWTILMIIGFLYFISPCKMNFFIRVTFFNVFYGFCILKLVKRPILRTI